MSPNILQYTGGSTIQEVDMKSIKKNVFMLAVAALVAVAIVAVAGCASSPAQKAAQSVSSSQKTEVLDDKGAAFGISTPEWVTAYIMNGNSAVQKLPAYKDKYCFVVENNDSNKDFAVAWVQNASGPQQIAAKISTTVSSSASNALEGEKGSDLEASLKAASEQLSNASFNGATKEADWWQIVRNTATNVTECRAFALWVIDRKSLDNQVAAAIQRIIDQNKAMSEAEKSIYGDLIKQIRGVGGFGSLES
jgi:hypothetical protein